MLFKKYLGLSLSLLLTASLTACLSDDDDNNNNNNTEDAKALDLRILHLNDHHSHLNPDTGANLDFNGQSTRVAMGGFSKVITQINRLTAQGGNVLKLHAGDAITGDLYYTLFKGEADAAMMNHVCFDAFALGNHEFDDGDAGLVKFLDYLKAGNCAMPTSVLAANVAPELGVSALAQSTATDYIQPYTIKEFDGEKVGIIGIDIAQKTKNSSNPDASTQFLDETATAQKYIDELRDEKGVNKIILLTHYQYKNDLTLAQNLHGVDAIVGGDSHSLLGDSFSNYGLNSAGSYPTQLQNKDGKNVCVVQAWQYSAIVGELNISFDENGDVTSCQGTPHLLLADSFKRKDDTGTRVELTGAARQEVLDIIAAAPELSIVADDTNADATLAQFAEQVEVQKNTLIGSAATDLCLERIPNQGKSALCDASATSANGSDISNIVSKAFLEMSNTSDICIQNAGGVRIDVPAGDISIGTAYTLLPFANTLVEIKMTGQQIINVLEEAFTYAIDPEGSTGAYPYAAGLRWSVDRSKPAGQRFSQVEVNPRLAGTWQAINPSATYRVVTNSFISAGRDGYLTFGQIADELKVDTYLDYAQSFVDYVKREGTINKLPLDEYSTQQYFDESGSFQQ